MTLEEKYNCNEMPDQWVIVKLQNEEDHRVFAAWNGGYLDRDSWRLNSGIAEIEADENFYYFTGHSGSCYKCHKKAYGIRNAYATTILNELIRVNTAHVLEDTNWLTYGFKEAK